MMVPVWFVLLRKDSIPNPPPVPRTGSQNFKDRLMLIWNGISSHQLHMGIYADLILLVS